MPQLQCTYYIVFLKSFCLKIATTTTADVNTHDCVTGKKTQLIHLFEQGQKSSRRT